MDTFNNENLLLINFKNGLIIIYNYVDLTTITSNLAGDEFYERD